MTDILILAASLVFLVTVCLLAVWYVQLRTRVDDLEARMKWAIQQLKDQAGEL